MKITKVEQLHADGGWRIFSFLKLSTDTNLVGWAEYNEAGWNRGLSAVIRALGGTIVGQDPRRIGRISTGLRAMTQMAPGGINDQAIAALENACVDLAAKDLNVPVSRLFGGAYRDSIRAYWSHCGSFRVRDAAYFESVLNTRPIETLDDFAELGREAVSREFTAAKLNPVLFHDGGPPILINPGFDPGGDLSGRLEQGIVSAIEAQLGAFRRGAGPEVSILLDVNFAFKAAGLRRVAQSVEPFDLLWLEADLHDAQALAAVRRSTVTPIGSLEAIYGQRGYRAYFECDAVDVAVVDVLWNGIFESVKIAWQADSHFVNVAPHNFYGPLASLMAAQFCASVPNVEIMEIEADDVPWLDDLVTAPIQMNAGQILIPNGPGWGADVNEVAVAEHPASSPS